MISRRYTIYIALIATLLTGLFTGRALFFSIAYLLGIVYLTAMFWAWRSVRGLSINRYTRTRRSQVGRTFSEQFAVRNTGLLPKLWLEVRDFSTLPDHNASHVVPAIMRKEQYHWQADTLCVVRGEFQLGPMTLTGGDPFGLFLIPRRVNASERIIIYPRTVPISQFSVPMGYLSGGEARHMMTHHVTTNAAGVREYVPGDSINRIHWRSTARRNKLIVKEFELDPMVDIWLLVDFSAQSLVEDPMVQRLGGTGTVIPGAHTIAPSTEEYSVIIAASLTQHFIEEERTLGFAAYAPGREVYYPERGHRQMTRIMEVLAVGRSRSEMSLKEMLALETPHFSRGATLIVITASLDTAWVAEMQILSRRGIRPMCIFLDPTSFGSPHSSDDLRGSLQLSRIPTLVIQRGDDIGNALAQTPIR